MNKNNSQVYYAMEKLKENNSFTQEEYDQKLNHVYKQSKEMKDSIRPFVRCGCLKKLEMHNTYKCLYCEEAFCKECAEIHFGKTVKEYRAENPIIIE